MKKFTLRDFILISLIAVISIITKPYIKSLSFSFTSMYNLPGGIIGGVFYMMWLSLIYRLVPKTGTVLLFSILQIFLAMSIMGMPPGYAMTFIPTGLAAELVFKFFKGSEIWGNILAGAVANAVGSASMYLLFFGSQKEPLMIGIAIALISGGASGILTQILINRLRAFRVAPQ